MKRRTAKHLLLVAAWLALAVCGRPVAADEAIPAEKRLPRNVLAYVSLRNFTEFKAQWPKTLFGQLEREESLADFRADIEKQLSEASKSLEDQLGLSLSELVSIPHGEIAAAAVAGQGGKISVVLFMDFGDREEAVQKLLAKAAESFEDEGVKRSEEDVDDTRVIVYHKPADDGNQKPHESGAYFLKDSFLVLGSDLSVLKGVLSRWDGKQERVLAENEVYHYIVDRCRDDSSESPPQLTWFVDPVATVQAFVASRPQAGQMALFMGMIPTLGFDKFRGVGGTFDMARGDYDMVSRTLVYLERPAKGVINMVQFDATAQAPPKWLSTEWNGYSGFNWNISKAYSAAEGLVDMFQGPGALAQLIQNLADNENAGGIHLKKDVLDQLTGTFHIADDEGGTKPGAAGGFLVAADVKNMAAFRATLAKAARIPLPQKISEREFQGVTVYEIEGGEGGGDDDEGEVSPRRFGIAVSDNHLLVASDVRLLERVLRGVGDGEALAESASYKRIARKFPAQTASISYSRQDAQFKTLYETLRGGHAGALSGSPGSLDFSKLPQVDALKKYLPASGGFMERDERGLKITSFSLRNESD